MALANHVCSFSHRVRPLARFQRIMKGGLRADQTLQCSGLRTITKIDFTFNPHYSRRFGLRILALKLPRSRLSIAEIYFNLIIQKATGTGENSEINEYYLSKYSWYSNLRLACLFISNSVAHSEIPEILQAPSPESSNEGNPQMFATSS
jgi:hypothetical protein